LWFLTEIPAKYNLLTVYGLWSPSSSNVGTLFVIRSLCSTFTFAVAGLTISDLYLLGDPDLIDLFLYSFYASSI
jgi:hypothetical protein